jgi:hypothetical protein
MVEQDNWLQWSKFVLMGIESLNKGQDELRKEFSNLRQDIANRGAEQERDWNNKIRRIDLTLSDNSQRLAKLEEMSNTNKWAWRLIIGGVILSLVSGLVALALSLAKPSPPLPRIHRIEQGQQERPSNSR